MEDTRLERPLDRLVESVCEAGALVWGAALLVVAVYVSTELLSRKLFSVTLITGSNEISGYVSAIASTWAFSYSLVKRSHVRIDILTRALPSAYRAFLDVVAMLSMATFAASFVWFVTKYLILVWVKNTHSTSSLAVPIWVPVGAWYLGWVLFLIVTIYLAITSAIDLLHGAFAAVDARVGSSSGEEPIEIELSAGTQDHGGRVQ
jgi:TRAP-type C4-dicarboxylate transport system permease small subunit